MGWKTESIEHETLLFVTPVDFHHMTNVVEKIGHRSFEARLYRSSFECR